MNDTEALNNLALWFHENTDEDGQWGSGTDFLEYAAMILDKAGRDTDPPEVWVEDAEFDVTVTVAFHTNVAFSPIERDSPITAGDALGNFWGSGLTEIIEDVRSQGEYGATIIRQEVNRTA